MARFSVSNISKSKKKGKTMKKLWIVSVMVGIALLFGMQSAAQAIPYIEVAIIDTVNHVTQFVQSDTGKVTFDGVVGAWQVNVVTGLTYPFGGGTQSSPVLDLNSINATSSTGGNLIVFTDAIGYTGPIAGGKTGPFHFEAGGTVGGVSAGTLDLFALYNSNNVLFESGGTPFTVIGSLGTFTAGPFSGATDIAAFPGVTSPYALGIQAQIHHDGAGSTSFNASLESRQVPEPTTMLLLGSGLIGLVGLKRNFNRK